MSSSWSSCVSWQCYGCHSTSAHGSSQSWHTFLSSGKCTNCHMKRCVVCFWQQVYNLKAHLYHRSVYFFTTSPRVAVKLQHDAKRTRLKAIAARGDECLLVGGGIAAWQTRVGRVSWFNLSIRCVMSGELTKAGGVNDHELLLYHRAFKSLCAGKEGNVSNTCVSDLEGSLLNDLHLFSDLWTPLPQFLFLSSFSP